MERTLDSVPDFSFPRVDEPTAARGLRDPENTPKFSNCSAALSPIKIVGWSGFSNVVPLDSRWETMMPFPPLPTGLGKPPGGLRAIAQPRR